MWWCLDTSLHNKLHSIKLVIIIFVLTVLKKKQFFLSSSSPFGQSMNPSHRTWSSMHLNRPSLSGVGQANRSNPSSVGGHSVITKYFHFYYYIPMLESLFILQPYWYIAGIFKTVRNYIPTKLLQLIIQYNYLRHFSKTKFVKFFSIISII